MSSIKDVAAKAGVSTTTVSRVLSQPQAVRPALRAQVEQAIAALGYRPNLAARRLRQQRASLLGLIVSDIRSPFFTDVGRAVEDMAYRHGLRLILCNTDENPEKEHSYLQLMADEQASGVIYSPTLEGLRRFRPSAWPFPVVMVDRALPDTPVDRVLLDNAAAARQLTEHLLAAGYRRIALLVGHHSTTGQERQAGYEAALQAHGLSPEVHRVAPTREAGTQVAAALLAQAGHALPAYVDSLLQREKLANTFLGQGVAIPHGMIEDRHLVQSTGLAVLQVPAGVRWGDDAKQAHLVVAIAAASDEHIAVLRRLTRLMRDEALMQRLISTHDAQDIVRALTTDGEADAPAPSALQDFALGREVALSYPNGLHARPAGQWAQTAQRFAARVHVRYDQVVVDAKNVAALLSLGAGRGATLRLSAQGPDAEEALRALRAVVVRLGEEEARQAQLASFRQSQAQGLGQVLGDWQPAARQTFTGIAASPGLVIGTLVQAAGAVLQVDDHFRSAPLEAQALEQALQAALAELEAWSTQARGQGQAEQAGIFSAHAGLLRDPRLLQAVSRGIVQGHGAAWAWRQALGERVAAQRALPDATLAARAADLQDAGERVLRHLLGLPSEALGGTWPADAILLADDLSPSFTAQIDPARVLGFCTASGGPTAHTAILARALGLPAVVAGGPDLLQADSGTPAILDGYRGRLYVAPSATALIEAREKIEGLARRQAEEARHRLLPATTPDGHTVEMAANVNRADQVARALEAGAEGVGLMRTEFLFLERDTVPDEEAQYLALRAMVEALGGRPLVVRTLDIGGDKQVPHLQLPVEDNPFLGVRGARLALRRDDLLLPQLRALYRAARHGPLQIMFPMISTVEEVLELRRRMAQVREELDAPEVPIGIMIEVPSAALLADRLAAHVDFFSIGTNDLTQYTLAVDRQHPELAAMADSLHPAVLRLVERTVAGARRHGRWVGVCGGLAGEPLGAALLVGLGVDELSMSVGDLGPIKALLRRHRLSELQALAQRALDLDSADEVRTLGAALRSGDAAEAQA